MNKEKGFTLIELLIVIGILAVLASATVFVLNPAELLKRARDNNRISDLEAINKALKLTEVYGITDVGDPAKVYISLPDIGADTCNSATGGSSYTLPSVSPKTYACVASTNLRSTTGNGWIPVNFSSISTGSPLSKLPIDPVNSPSANTYYTYIMGGSWSLTAAMESTKFLKETNLSDGGADPTRYEAGTDKDLWTSVSGLVGYWPMDNSAVDISGNNINGNVAGSLSWPSGEECVKGSCVETAGGSGNYINLPVHSKLNLTSNVSYVNWLKIKTAVPTSSWPISLGNVDSHRFYGWRSTSNGTNWMFEYGQNNPTCDGAAGGWSSTGTTNLGTNTWHQLVATYDGANIRTYIDGLPIATRNFTLGFCSNSSSTYRIAQGGISPAVYVVDEARIYNRALSASEVQAIYSATK